MFKFRDNGDDLGMMRKIMKGKIRFEQVVRGDTADLIVIAHQ